MYIKQLKSSDFAKYDAFSASHGTIFSSRTWLGLFGNGIKIFGIFDAGDHFIGGFHLFEKKFGFCKFQLNPPFTPFIGPFFLEKSQTKFNRQSFRKQLLQLMSNTLTEQYTCMQIFSLDRHIVNTMPFFWREFDIWPRYTFRIDLEQSKEKILSSMSGARRKNMTRAEKDGIICRSSSNANTIFDVVFKTSQRRNLTKDITLKKKIIESYAGKPDAISYISYKSNRPIAAVFCVHDNKTAYYMFSGYDAEDTHHGAGATAVWQCILEAKKRGLQYFDFDGSIIPELEKYFRGFGGEIIPFYRISKLNYFIKLGLLISGKSLS